MDPIIPQPEQPQYQAPMPEHKHFMNKKFIVTFIILLLLGAGAYGSIWYWQGYRIPSASEIKDFESCFRYVHGYTKNMVSQCQAPDGRIFPNPSWNDNLEVKDWQTYRNEEYGFEFKYPSFNPEISSDTEVSILNDDVPENGPSAWWVAKAQEMWHKIYNNRTIYKNGDECPPTEGYEVCTVYTINPLALKRQGGYGDNSVPVYNLNILTSDFQITIHLLPSKGIDDTINQILSTYKFIDSRDLSTWKTHTNTEYGFQVKLNPDWKVIYYKNSALLLPSPGGGPIEVDSKIANSININGNMSETGCNNCYITIEESPKISLEDWVKQTGATVKTKTQLDGQPAYNLVTQVMDIYERSTIFVRDNAQGTLKFRIYSQSLTQTPNQPQFDSMVSTFKFIKD